MPTDKNSKWEKENGEQYRRDYAKNKYDAIVVRIRKDGINGFTLADLKQYADKKRQSLNSYIVSLIRKDMGDE